MDQKKKNTKKHKIKKKKKSGLGAVWKGEFPSPLEG